MSNRKDFYFREQVTEAELDSAFADLEDADHNLTGDLGFVGVVANAVVSQHAPVPDLTVDVSGPGAIYDQLGQRIFFSALQTVNLGADDNGVATVVSAAGKEKVVSLFAKFDRALSDPRIDGNSLTVFFRRDESFKFVVAQGGEANAGGAIPPPLRSDAILLADITRRFNQVQILAADISTARRQDAFALAGAPRGIRRGRALEAISDLLGYYNAHASGAADRHAAAALDYAGGPNWLDGTANPATTVDAQLDKIVADLAVGPGSTRVLAVASPGQPNALAAGSVQSHFDSLLGFLNGHVTAATAHPAAAISYGGGPAWRDGTANSAAAVEAQLDKIINDLAADAGATRIGSPARPDWLDGVSNPTASVFEAMAKLVTDLVAQAAAGDGAGRVGARASGHLVAGTVRSQLDALDSTSVRTNVPNAFTATQTLNGADGDASAAMATTSLPQVRKLLWEIHGPAYSYRFYAGIRALELVVNAKWVGAQWAKDIGATASSKLLLNNNELQVFADDGSASPFNDDSWKFAVSFALNQSAQTLDIGGNWVSAGPTETYAGAFNPGGVSIMGGSCSFRKQFPATPSSITFTLTSQVGFTGLPAAIAPTPVGTGVFTGASNPGNFFCRVRAS
jgi:hypothetical protein